MKTNLEKVSHFEIENWLVDELNLTSYQKEKLLDRELVRFCKYEFYKKRKFQKVSFVWRFTIILLPVYILLIYALVPIKFLLTGKYTYSQKFFDNFHSKWMNKLNLLWQ